MIKYQKFTAYTSYLSAYKNKKIYADSFNSSMKSTYSSISNATSFSPSISGESGRGSSGGGSWQKIII